MSKGAALRNGYPPKLWDALEDVSQNCGYPSDYIIATEEAGYRLIPWQADTYDHNVMGALQMLVDALNDEPLRGGAVADERWAEWFNDRFTPAWTYALMASGRYKDDPSLLRFSSKDRADYLAAMSEPPRSPSEPLCQCGHSREQHESRYNAPGHCTHRCIPPWSKPMRESNVTVEASGAAPEEEREP